MQKYQCVNYTVIAIEMSKHKDWNHVTVILTFPTENLNILELSKLYI